MKPERLADEELMPPFVPDRHGQAETRIADVSGAEAPIALPG